MQRIRLHHISLLFCVNRLSGCGLIVCKRAGIAYIEGMEKQTNIQVLPAQVANQIAAGEVVDRPASIVKELVENAIDAGATRLDIVVTAGGRKLIRVTDNGCGMGREDAVLSVRRHATSKIRAAQDMSAIRTLGFRGEALAAISSVSRFRLETSRERDTVGTALVQQGEELEVQDCGAPSGTQIEVRDLFYNVPARRKFLRTDQTELQHIRDAVLMVALAYPALALRLVVDGRDIYRLAAGGTLEDRIRELFHFDLVKNLARLQYERSGVRVTGFVSRPVLHRADRNEQYLFVNQRPVRPALLRYAIGEGYRMGLPKGRHPSVFLFVSMDPSLVDVNVHPTKREIRFRRPGIVRDCVVAAIEHALRSGLHAGAATQEEEQVAQPETDTAADTVPDHASPPVEARPLTIPDLPPARTFQYPRGTQATPAPPLGGLPIDEIFGSAAPGPDGAAPESASTSEQAGPAKAAPWAWCQVLGQIGGVYVAMETETGLVLLDPRAAHERVLYERMTACLAAGTVPSQPLLLPETLTLTPRDAAHVRSNIALFASIGFGISPFGGDGFLLDAVPSVLEGVSAGPILQEMISALREKGGRSAKGLMAQHLVEAACYAAVGLRKELTLSEIEKLVTDLAACDMPYTSPRGRPTLILMSLKELHRKFGRSPGG